MFTKDELNKKKNTELAAIAEELGIQLVAENTAKGTYITEILQAQQDDAALTIVSEGTDREPEPEPELEPEPKIKAPKAEKKFRISISNQDGIENTPFIKVGVNDTMYAIPRETEVVVPASVIEVLNNAVTTRFVQEGRELVARSAKRFPFSILGEVK